MEKWQIKLSPVFAITVVVALLVLVSLSTYGKDSEYVKVDKVENLEPHGFLIATDEITMNGYPTRTGATVQGDATIATGKGITLIELGALGLIRIGPNSKIRISLCSNYVEIMTICGKTELSVKQGQAEIKSPEPRTMRAGDKASFPSSTNLVTTGNTDISILCESGRRTAVIAAPGLAGLLIPFGSLPVTPVLTTLEP